jgi:murein L,D-transpeptidase YcbB/YkuD
MSDHVRLFMQKSILVCAFAFCAAHAEVSDSTPPAAVNKNYTLLAEVLPLYEHALIVPWPTIPETSRLLHKGSNNQTVLLLRERLQATRDLPLVMPNTTKFDKALEVAVKLFQWRHGLKADGVVGAGTRAALNVSPEVRVQQIRTNMQRWAQLSNQLQGRYVLVNIPEFQLHLIDDDSEVLTMKVIVGKPTRQTPELTSHITRIVFNPKWNVPAMIAKNDIVPKVIENPAYLNSEGIRIFNSDQSDSYELSRSDIDWEDARANGFPYNFRQDPGAKNALGLVKFEFQNTHDVYMHDTPAKNLFASDVRDFSSGCIRLEKPFALVDYLTLHDDRIDAEKIQDTLASQKTTYFRVDNPLPIVVAYLTAWVDDKGYTHFADDIYHLDDPSQPSDIPQDSAHGPGASDDDNSASADNTSDDSNPHYQQTHYSSHTNRKYDDRFERPAYQNNQPRGGDNSEDRWPPDPGMQMQ